MMHPSKRRIGEGQHCHCSISQKYVSQLCQKASVGHTITLGTANLTNVRFLINVTTVASPTLHEIVAVVGSPFVGSQALATECHKLEVIGQHTWLERILGSTIQLPTQQDPQSVQKDKATLSVSKTRSCVPTPIKTSKLAQWINGYDRDLAMFLCQGFQRGFKVGFVGTPLSKYVHNLKSTDEHPQVVQDYIDRELQADRIKDPFHSRLSPNIKCLQLEWSLKKRQGNLGLFIICYTQKAPLLMIRFHSVHVQYRMPLLKMPFIWSKHQE